MRRAERRMLLRVVALKPENAHAQQAIVGQLITQAGRYGAEVLTDDDAAVAPGLQRHEPQQVLQWIAQVHTVERARPFGDHPQPHEAEHVVDADAARYGHHRTQHLDESRKALGAHRPRVEGGQAPVLALCVEYVGRRAHR